MLEFKNSHPADYSEGSAFGRISIKGLYFVVPLDLRYIWEIFENGKNVMLYKSHNPHHSPYQRSDTGYRGRVYRQTQLRKRSYISAQMRSKKIF